MRSHTLAPFLYPCVYRPQTSKLCRPVLRRCVSTVNDLPESRLNPAPDDYSTPNFADKAQLTLQAGRGGNGCVSFLRDAYQPDGPPNGGDGGVGGSVYIQAAHGETSLHKLARKRFIRAGRGKHGMGSARSGPRGDDFVITVPVGTIVRELERADPSADEQAKIRLWRFEQREKLRKERREEDALRRERKQAALEQAALEAELLRARQEREGEEEMMAEDELEEEYEEDEDFTEEVIGDSRKSQPHEEEDLGLDDPQRHKWLLYPGMSKNDMKSTSFPRLPRRDRFLQQPPAPVYLDLSRPTPRPILLACGGIGGLGNPHFTSKQLMRPIFATKGEEAVSMKIELELKLLADVGLVGLPNAGKSTLLRAITNSRTRVGNWAFTTLQPNVGTVVLDKYSGRPVVQTHRRYPAQPGLAEEVEKDPRTRFTVADIPGLIEGAHLDRGLGIAFLRHVERAGVLAFVIDLSAGDAVTALKSLWREVGLYARMRDEEEGDREHNAMVDQDVAAETSGTINLSYAELEPDQEESQAPALSIAGKPWFVVATKADLPETQENFGRLKAYVDDITAGKEVHPSGVEYGWTEKCAAIPISAINGQGVDRIVHWTVGLLDE